MTATLRPMSLGEILDHTFQIYRAKLFAFVGIAALPVLAMLSIQIANLVWIKMDSLDHPYNFYAVIVWRYLVLLGLYHIFEFLFIFTEPAFVSMTSSSAFGEKQSLCGSLRFVGDRWKSYLGIAVLKLLVQLIAPELFAAGVILGFAFIADANGVFIRDSGLLTFLIFAVPALVGLILFVWLGIGLSLTIPAAALEKVRGIKALRRSWNLTNGSRRRIVLLWLLVAVGGWVLELGVGLAFREIVIHAIASHLFVYSPLIYRMAIECIYSLISMFIVPICPIALTLIYYDQRIRKEGYDIERMMEAAGLNAPVPSPVGVDDAAPGQAEEAQA